ncbi:unnamed protein product [Brachionus calyciflorus]|uniref:Uncharacterized protein n=1 Tax=Brachionus calyciflorus TaxID=104777 RepID=A0A813MAH8_9BILA|nr:unnamed protein product [Brachionus calyciflorus]
MESDEPIHEKTAQVDDENDDQVDDDNDHDESETVRSDDDEEKDKNAAYSFLFLKNIDHFDKIYFRSIEKRTRITHTLYQECRLCSNDHEMTSFYFEKSSKARIFKKYDHNDNQKDVFRGIIPELIKIIDDQVRTKDSSATRIKTFLIKNRLAIENENPLLVNFQLPKVSQIQNHKTYLRQHQLGNNN